MYIGIFAFFILLLLIGLRYWIYIGKSKGSSNVVEKSEKNYPGWNASSFQKIEMNYENCEFKVGDYLSPWQENLIRKQQREGMGDVAPEPIPAYNLQSVLKYRHSTANGSKIYISDIFPFSVEALKIYVMNKEITLYINRFSSSKYFFKLDRIEG